MDRGGVAPEGGGRNAALRAQKVFDYTTAGIDYDQIERRVVEGNNVTESILAEAEGYDFIVIGASEEPLFKNLLVGNVAEQVAKRAKANTIMVKRRSGALHSVLRQTVLMPSTNATNETNDKTINVDVT